ncbi:MAG TPA: hypothetical protein VKB19_09380 [Pedobacter sp.]|nr:hypothetical protein [Pedobacter sp.]
MITEIDAVTHKLVSAALNQQLIDADIKITTLTNENARLRKDEQPVEVTKIQKRSRPNYLLRLL